MKISLSRTLLVIAPMLVGTTLIATPARADDEATTCGRNPAQADAAHAMEICARTMTGADFVWADGHVVIGPNWPTSATGCKVTTRITLATKPDGNTWTHTGPSLSCNYALTHRGKPGSGSVLEGTGTTARYGQGVVCVDLYFNHSSSSGWQWCHYGKWLPVD
jgi:prepilin-type processing-associated H-X9-DG protein